MTCLGTTAMPLGTVGEHLRQLLTTALQHSSLGIWYAETIYPESCVAELLYIHMISTSRSQTMYSECCVVELLCNDMISASRA